MGSQPMWQTGKRLFIDVDGARLEAQCCGLPPHEADTIVLLHEGLGCVDLWRDFPEQLSKQTGMGVFAYSRQGYGQSDLRIIERPVDFMSFDALTVLPRVLEAIDFRRGLFVGHSDGASIAAIYAGSIEDERLRGVALMAPHFFIEQKALHEIKKAQVVYAKGALGERMAKYHCDPDHTFFGWSNAWLKPEFASWDIQHVLPGIKVPVLAIQGCDDQYGTVAQIDVIGEIVGDLLERHILPDCKHIPYLEQQERTCDLVSDFAKRICR